MDKVYEMLKDKLETMRFKQESSVTFDFHEVSQVYQIVCLMKQIKGIVNWGDLGYE